MIDTNFCILILRIKWTRKTSHFHFISEMWSDFSNPSCSITFPSYCDSWMYETMSSFVDEQVIQSPARPKSGRHPRQLPLLPLNLHLLSEMDRDHTVMQIRWYKTTLYYTWFCRSVWWLRWEAAGCYEATYRIVPFFQSNPTSDTARVSTLSSLYAP